MGKQKHTRELVTETTVAKFGAKIFATGVTVAKFLYFATPFSVANFFFCHALFRG